METHNLPTTPSTPDPMIDWAIAPLWIEETDDSLQLMGPRKGQCRSLYFNDERNRHLLQKDTDSYYLNKRDELEHLRLSELEWEECMAGGSRYITSNAGQFVYTVEKGNEKYYACINFSSKRLHSGALVYFEPFETEELAIQAIQQERIRLVQQILGL